MTCREVVRGEVFKLLKLHDERLLDYILLRESKLRIERDMWQIKFSIERGECIYLSNINGTSDHISSMCNQCQLHIKLNELEVKLGELND